MPGLYGHNIHLGCFGLLAPETGYTRYLLDNEKHNDIYGKITFVTFSFEINIRLLLRGQK